MPKHDPKLIDIFKKYEIEKQRNGCWYWTRSLDGSGYGNLSVNNKMWRAHRYFFYVAYGKHPGNNVVMHKCDTPICVNPEHLSLGTQLDNIADRHRKGRNGACRGDDAPWSKLSSNQIPIIKRMFEEGIPRIQIMEKFNISKTQMYRIVKGESWRHING